MFVSLSLNLLDFWLFVSRISLQRVRRKIAKFSSSNPVMEKSVKVTTSTMKNANTRIRYHRMYEPSIHIWCALMNYELFPLVRNVGENLSDVLDESWVTRIKGSLLSSIMCKKNVALQWKLHLFVSACSMRRLTNRLSRTNLVHVLATRSEDEKASGLIISNCCCKKYIFCYIPKFLMESPRSRKLKILPLKKLNFRDNFVPSFMLKWKVSPCSPRHRFFW